MPADAVIIDVEGGGVDLGDAIVIDDVASSLSIIQTL